MTDQRPLIEKVLDLAVFAPIGLFCTLRTDAPEFVEARREQLANRVQVARWVGEMTVTYGRQRLEARVVSPVRAAVHAPEAEPALAPVLHRSPPFYGYDTLAAAQVVQLLGRLPHSELHLVLDYESSGRKRRTILAKIDQLLAT